VEPWHDRQFRVRNRPFAGRQGLALARRQHGPCRDCGRDQRRPRPLDHDIVTQLLLSRGVPRDDLERHRNPSLRAFLPDPSEFRDMDAPPNGLPRPC
jgi:hypothetical protein